MIGIWESRRKKNESHIAYYAAVVKHLHMII